jgi:tRNA(His) 5'-end guanylyltransferase
MASIKLEEKEVFSNLRIQQDSEFFIRLDGRRFSGICKLLNAEKPFDLRIARCLLQATRAVYSSGFNPSLCYLCSDEVNLLFLPPSPFNGRIEKLDSVLASMVSSGFTLAVNEIFGNGIIASFDSRAILTPAELIFKYLTWRQRESNGNYLNAYGYWTLIREGLNPRDVAKQLKRLDSAQIAKLIAEHGVDLSKKPIWQRKGILLYRKTVVQYRTAAGEIKRTRLEEDWRPPDFASRNGRLALRRILSDSAAKSDICRIDF